MKSFSELKKERTIGMQIKLIIFCVCLIASIITYVILKAGVKNFYTYPSLFSFALFFGLFGLSYITLALIKKDILSYFVSAFCVVISVILFLCTIKHVSPWIVVVVGLGLFICAFLLGMALAGRQLTDPLTMKNEDPEYKNYKQRREEAEQAKKEEPEEELPEIKSFKD